MRAVIYARVSTEEQAEEGHSIEAQVRLAKQFCRHKRWKVVEQYIDRGWSARTMRRPRLQDLLAEAHAGNFDVIVVHKLDRLSLSLAFGYAQTSIRVIQDQGYVCVGQRRL